LGVVAGEGDNKGEGDGKGELEGDGAALAEGEGEGGIFTGRTVYILQTELHSLIELLLQ
jgi:hypothetical protein